MVYLTVCSRRHERRMAHDSEAARARAEASFRKPEPRGDDAKSARDAAKPNRNPRPAAGLAGAT